jgi:2,4-dienoyl-CoA reductase-like NADH-dependent reductase (Old Yellow Enzyme family)
LDDGSAVCAPIRPGWHTPEALTRAGLNEVREQFVDSARRSLRIGFDLIELHAGHGYLLHEFLSPISNQRDDEYGGSTANRMRFPLEVFAAVRAVWPADRPLGVRGVGHRLDRRRLDGGGDGGVRARAQSARLRFRRCDLGQLDPRQKIPARARLQRTARAEGQSEAGVVTMAVGLITKPQQAEELVAQGKADLVALARGMMDDPRWAWHAARELGAETAYAPNYVRCSPRNGSPEPIGSLTGSNSAAAL